jgi:uncharacterized membrane protein YidH (DUF202 family)
MFATYYLIALITSFFVILLGLFALIMAIVRFSKAKQTSDPQMKQTANKRFSSTILSAIVLFIVGIGLMLVVLFFMG